MPSIKYKIELSKQDRNELIDIVTKGTSPARTILIKPLTNITKSDIIKRVKKMPKKYNISSEQIKEITEARKTIKDKTADRRLRAVQLRGEGLSDKEISARLETTSNMILIYRQNISEKCLKNNKKCDIIKIWKKN